MEGGVTVINKVDLFASIKASKPTNSSKKSDFQSNPSEKACSFRDSLKEVSNNMNQDNNASLRAEMVNNSKAKLKDSKKPESTIDEETGSSAEAKEKQIEKIVNRMEEIVLNLQELADLQQQGQVPEEKHTALTDGIREAYQDLTAFQNKLTKLGDVQLQTEAPELKALLEGILNELKADVGLEESGNSANFMQKLEAVVEETLTKLEAVSTNVPVENNETQPVIDESGSTNETETDLNTSGNENVLENQSQEKTDSMTTESKKTTEPADNQNNAMKAEAPAVGNKTVIKENKTETTVTEEEKNALDSKVEKASVESKESKKSNEQHTEEGTGKEASKEVHMAAKSKQNKPMNGDMTGIKLEQTVTEDNSEVVISQTEAPKAQTLSRTEIINQIVKKAEIILTDAQSEMRMQLEPENLGKLTLKISVERGLITAKFAAESYEVKQIIESSLNELKDMLHEKGLEVQNFSVSVGQDNREFNNSNAFQQWKETVKLNGNSMNRGSYEGYLNGEARTARAANPYSVHNGQFDHSA